MKTLKNPLFLFFSILSIVACLTWLTLQTQQPVIHIALVGPMTGANQADGQEMLDGTRLLLKKINKAGGIDGKKIRLLVYDDENNTDVAEQRAKEIIADGRALLVLGHLFSSTSTRAGEIYKQAGIAAISGSATVDELTKNPWYFRVIFNNHSQAVFLANYVYVLLKQSKISIIYDQDAYGRSLNDNFARTFRSLGGEVQYTWSFDRKQDNIETQIAGIVNQAVAANNSDKEIGWLFLATHANEGRELIVKMKRKGMRQRFVGPDALGSDKFAVQFNQYREEQQQAGYFTDGIFAISPVIFDIAGEQALQFRDEFQKAYQHLPGWRSATYYDAATMAVSALQRMDWQQTDLSYKRKKLRDILAGFDNEANAILGIGGAFHLDKKGNAVKSMAIGYFQRQHLVPALNQFQQIANIKQITDLNAELKRGSIRVVDNRYMYVTRVVYTGIDINSVSNLNIKNNSYTLDFYLWFRYRDKDVDFNDTLEFSNSVEPIKLGKPLDKSVSDNGIGYRVYRIKADFKSNFLFNDYPFDLQSLMIKFRHPTATRERLIFVPDVLGMRYSGGDALLAKLERARVFETITDWRLKSALFFQDIEQNESTLGNPHFFDLDTGIQYSRFNMKLVIQRDVLSFGIKNLFPLFVILILSYFAFFLPLEYLTVRVAVGINAMMTIAFFHLKLSGELPGIGYLVALDYAFYAIYMIIILNLLTTLLMLYLKEDEYKQKIVTRTALLLYPALIFFGMLFFLYQYKAISLPNFSTPTHSAAHFEMDTEKREAEQAKQKLITTLTMTSNDPDIIEPMTRILDAFNVDNPTIKIKYQPMDTDGYLNLMEAQLKKGKEAADLVFMPPYSRTKAWFESGYLYPLNDLFGIKAFHDKDLNGWRSGEVVYGVPMMAISHGVYYNQTIFNELGLEIPTSWEALLSSADTIKQAGYYAFANGSQKTWSTMNTLFEVIAPNFIGGATGRQAYLSGERCFDDPHAIRVFKALQEIEPYLASEHEKISYYDSQALFQQGKAAMWINASWEIVNIEQQAPDLKWSIFAVPAPEGQPTYVNFHPEMGYGINAHSQNIGAAVTFLEWLTEDSTAELIADTLYGYYPILKNMPQVKNEHARTFLALQKNRETDIRWSSESLQAGVNDGYNLMLHNAVEVLQGRSSPEQAASNVQKGLNTWFKPAQTCQTTDQTTGNDN